MEKPLKIFLLVEYENSENEAKSEVIPFTFFVDENKVKAIAEKLSHDHPKGHIFTYMESYLGDDVNPSDIK